MKCTIIYFVLSLFVLSCNNMNNRDISNSDLVGIWNNAETQNTGIEFTEDSKYYVYTDIENKKKSEQSLNYKIENINNISNITIYDDDLSDDYCHSGKIEIADNVMILVLYKDKKQVSRSEFVKI